MRFLQSERALVDDASVLEESSSMRAIRAVIDSIADTDAPVLIRGETGSG